MQFPDIGSIFEGIFACIYLCRLPALSHFQDWIPYPSGLPSLPAASHNKAKPPLMHAFHHLVQFWGIVNQKNHSFCHGAVAPTRSLRKYCH